MKTPPGTIRNWVRARVIRLAPRSRSRSECTFGDARGGVGAGRGRQRHLPAPPLRAVVALRGSTEADPAPTATSGIARGSAVRRHRWSRCSGRGCRRPVGTIRRLDPQLRGVGTQEAHRTRDVVNLLRGIDGGRKPIVDGGECEAAAGQQRRQPRGVDCPSARVPTAAVSEHDDRNRCAAFRPEEIQQEWRAAGRAIRVGGLRVVRGVVRDDQILSVERDHACSRPAERAQTAGPARAASTTATQRTRRVKAIRVVTGIPARPSCRTRESSQLPSSWSEARPRARLGRLPPLGGRSVSGHARLARVHRVAQDGSRPMKPRSLVWASAPSATSTRAPN